MYVLMYMLRYVCMYTDIHKKYISFLGLENFRGVTTFNFSLKWK